MDQRYRARDTGAASRVRAWLFSLAAPLWPTLSLLGTLLSAVLLRWTLIREWLCLIHIRVLEAARVSIVLL
jgi:hypothetical protein